MGVKCQRKKEEEEKHNVMLWSRLIVRLRKAGGVDTRYKRGIHTTTGRRRTIDNRRCISFDLPNIAKKTLTVHYWMSA